MSDMDILRILCEFDTVTVADIADGLEMTTQGAHGVLRRLIAKRLIERVRIERAHLYAPTAKGSSAVSKMPPIDPEERCLPLTWEGITVCDCGNEPHYQNTRQFVMDGQIWCRRESRCRTCGAVHSTTEWRVTIEEVLF